MADVASGAIRSQLIERRRRLETATATAGPAPQLVRLLQDVDAALERMDKGTFGLCVVCHDPVEPDRLMADPLTTVCLGDLGEDERRALERDLELALKIQNALLPPRDLAAGGWETCYEYSPAGPVSGDYCHLSATRNGAARLFFAVGDVSGKGISASLLMSHLQAIFRTLLPAGLPVTGLVERANHVLCEGTLPTHYATLACGEAGANGEIELCNAGHCPPVLIRGGECSTLEAGGLPIGLFARGVYSSTNVRLAPGDSLVLYTDGLSEARDAGGAEFGVDRLTGLLREHSRSTPGEMMRAVLNNFARFTAGAPRVDDLTMMVVRRVGTAS